MKDGKITLRELHPSLRDKLNPNEVICNVEVKSSDKTSVLNQILYIKNINTNNVEEYSIVSPIIEVKLKQNETYEIWLNDKIDYVTPEKKIILTNKNTDVSFVYIKDEVLCNVSISCNNGESVVGQKLTVTNNKTQDSKTYILDTGHTVLNLKSSTSYTFSLDEKMDYITPKQLILTTNKLGIENNVSMQYMLDETNVTINITCDDGTPITKQTLSIKNNKTQETTNIEIINNITLIKLKTNTLYTFSLNSKKGYVIPDSKSITTGGLGSSNTVSLKYLRDLANLIINVRCSDRESVIGQIVSVQNITTGIIENHTLNNNILNLKVESKTSYLVWANDKNNYLPIEKQTIEVKEFNSDNNVELLYDKNEINCIINIECSDNSSYVGQTLSFTNIKTEEVEHFEIISNPMNIKLKTLTEYKISSSVKEGYLFQEKTITTSRVGNTDNITVTYLKDEVDLQINIINELEISEIGQIMSIKNVLTSETKDMIIIENPMNLKLKYNTEYLILVKDKTSKAVISNKQLITKSINDTHDPILIVCTNKKIYGIDIDENNSDPNTSVTYTNDSIGFDPVFINSSGIVNYGSWEDTFIFKGNRPCMLKDGVVNYYLNENDHTLKENGEPADIISGNDGDCMVEFKQTWYKIYKEGSIVKFRVANYKVDETYCSNAFISEKDPTQFGPMYYGMYNGKIIENRLRSLSGSFPTTEKPLNVFRNAATINGTGYQQITLSKINYIKYLTLLVIKSLNCKLSLNGNVDCGRTIGSLNKTGRFYGGKSGIKIFFIENVYTIITNFIDGCHFFSYDKVFYKIHGEYNNECIGYESVSSINKTYGIISKIDVSNDYGIIPIECKGSSTTYYCTQFNNLRSPETFYSVGIGNINSTLNNSILHVVNSLEINNGNYNYGARLTFS